MNIKKFLKLVIFFIFVLFIIYLTSTGLGIILENIQKFKSTSIIKTCYATLSVVISLFISIFIIHKLEKYFLNENIYN